MPEAHLVSVVVPTRNSGRTIEACLSSIRGQTYQALELIVIDNQSTDSTLAVAQRFADLVETFGPERSAQRNRGAHLARGEFLFFVDSDMRVGPRVVSSCIEALGENSAMPVVVPEETVGEGFLARCRALERSCYKNDDGVEAARFFRRSAFESVGGFDENLVGVEDWDLTIRVAGGSRLPRAEDFIYHDEGRLRLTTLLAKKSYYASSSVYYWRKHGRKAARQANLVFRPAFLRNWRRLVRHPILTGGFLSLKAMETAAITWGVVIPRPGSNRPKQLEPQRKR